MDDEFYKRTITTTIILTFIMFGVTECQRGEENARFHQTVNKLLEDKNEN